MIEIEKRRLHAIHEAGILAQPFCRFDRIAELARRLFDVPVATVSFVGSDIVIHAGRAGTVEPTTPRALSPCPAAIEADEITLRRGAEVTTGWSGFGDGAEPLLFFAGAPISLRSALRIGAVCIYDRQERPFGVADREALAVLAAIVTAEVQLPRMPCHY
jgi:GAF domain-containing protein